MRVVVADDVMLTREGIVRLLADAGIDVVAEADDAERLLREVRLKRPDAAIVDIRMPPTHTDEGLVATQRIRSEHPEVGVLVLSQYVEPSYAMRLLEEHPERVGYLLKQRVADSEAFCADVRRVAAGGSVLDPEVVSVMLGRAERGPIERLTERQREVLALMAEGRSNAGIAERLVLSEHTVHRHVTNILRKLDLPSRTAAAAFAVRSGLLDDVRT